eukprot:14161229-Heterocapsa_arctica.AAC.1
MPARSTGHAHAAHGHGARHAMEMAHAIAMVAASAVNKTANGGAHPHPLRRRRVVPGTRAPTTTKAL